MEGNTHTSKQAYVRQPHPSQTTYKPHETKRPQPTRLYETKVPRGAAYIIWAKGSCEPEHLCVPILYAYQTKHLFYRPCPAAKHNVIPPSCYELLHTTPNTTFHSSTTSPSASPPAPSTISTSLSSPRGKSFASSSFAAASMWLVLDAAGTSGS